VETWVIVVAAVVVLGVLYGWYAGIIKKKNKAKEALAGIDVQLNKRHDLIPNLLKIAKRFMEHEMELMTRVTELRSQASKTYDQTDAAAVKEHLAVENQLQGQMGQLMIQVENYPDLKSDQPMVQAQQSYNEVEAHISAARRFYNSAVGQLNNSIQIFPGNLLAGLAGAQEMPFFEAPEAVKAPVNADDFL
jgi:LemA protein